MVSVSLCMVSSNLYKRLSRFWSTSLKYEYNNILHTDDLFVSDSFMYMYFYGVIIVQLYSEALHN